MLLKELIDCGISIVGTLYPEREAREMVFVLLEHQIGTKRHTHIVEPGYEVKDEDASAAMGAFGRIASGEPLQYVTGVADFYGRKFRVTSDVLIPRPETEILCRELISKASSDAATGPGICESKYGKGERSPMPPGGLSPQVTGGWKYVQDPESVRILDLCTGSGCIAWTLALEISGSVVTAVDISDGALAVASSQDFSEEIARTSAVSPVFMKADVLAGPSVSGLSGRYDILVSNPPYVMDKEKTLMRPNVLDHEPHLALFVSDDDPLVFYRAIAGWALAVLKQGGYGIVEINEALGLQTADLFRDAGLRDVRIIKDLSDRDRFVSFRR